MKDNFIHTYAFFDKADDDEDAEEDLELSEYSLRKSQVRSYWKSIHDKDATVVRYINGEYNVLEMKYVDFRKEMERE